MKARAHFDTSARDKGSNLVKMEFSQIGKIGKREGTATQHRVHLTSQYGLAMLPGRKHVWDMQNTVIQGAAVQQQHARQRMVACMKTVRSPLRRSLPTGQSYSAAARALPSICHS